MILFHCFFCRKHMAPTTLFFYSLTLLKRLKYFISPIVEVFAKKLFDDTVGIGSTDGSVSDYRSRGCGIESHPENI